MSESISIRLLSWDKGRLLAAPIRHAVFVVEQGVPEDMEWDEYDAVSTHAVAMQSMTGLAVGTGRLLPPDNSGIAHIGRMAVLPLWRGMGVGSTMIHRLLEEARRNNVRKILLHAQIDAATFYERQGFRAEEKYFLEAGIPHVEMSLLLSAK